MHYSMWTMNQSGKILKVINKWAGEKTIMKFYRENDVFNLPPQKHLAILRDKLFELTGTRDLRKAKRLLEQRAAK